MTISLFLLPYALLVFIFIFFSFVAFYHLTAFGIKNLPTFFITFAFVAISTIILHQSWAAISQIDWSYPLLRDFSVLIPS